MQKSLSAHAKPTNQIDPLLPTIPRPSLLNRRTLWWLAAVGAIAWGLGEAGVFQGEVFNPGGMTQLLRFVNTSVHPQVDGEFLRLTLDATLTTLAFAVAGSALSIVIGFVGGIFGSEIWWQSVFHHRAGQYRAPWLMVRSFLALLRSIHEIVWGLIFVNIIGLDPLTAILAIAIPFGAITGKVFAEILDDTPRAAYTALLNSGVSPAKAMLYTLLPQASRDLLSYAFYRFECAIRAAAVLGIIGAGGLGFQIFVSLKTLNYEQVWTLLYALFLLNGIFDFWGAVVRRRLGTGGRSVDVGDDINSELDPCIAPQKQNRWVGEEDRFIQGSLIAVALLIPFSFWYLAPDFAKLFSSRAGEQLAYIVETSFPPDFAARSVGSWFDLTKVTLAMSILGTAFAGLVALPLAFPAANNFLLPGGIMDMGARGGLLRRVTGTAILVITRTLLLVARSIPPPIWALVLLYVLFPGILPGALALGIYTIGVLGRLMAEVVENLDERPLFGLKALGTGSGQVFLYGVMPPTTPRFIAYLLYRWEEIMRATVVIGLVGAGGLGRLLVQQLSSFDNQGVVATLLIFVALTFAVDLISMQARRAFR